MNPNGSAQGRLTNTPGFRNRFPAWSSSGAQIAFDSGRDGNLEIYVMNSDGSNQARRTNNGAFDVDPSWSPNDTQIAFTSTRAGDDDIWVMNADGSAPRALTTSVASDIQPAWSPDGSRIAFATNRDGFDYDVWVMNADGSNQHRLFATTAIDAAPNWSPDGNKVVLSTAFDGDNEIFTISASDPGNLSTQQRLTMNTVSDVFPAWSPDGSKIAFQSNVSGNNEVWVMSSSNGSGQINLTQGSQDEGRADWQRQLAPIATIAASPSSVLTRQSVTLNASGSSDPAGFITTYRWDLNGDGRFGSDTGRTPTISTSYSTARSVNVGVQTIDNDGLTSIARTTVTVRNQAPNPFFSISKNPVEPGDRVTFDGSGSNDSDGTIANYKWDLDGNGSFETDTGTSSHASKRYSKPRSLRVSLRVTDNNGASSETLKSLRVRAVIASGAKLYIGGSRNGVRVRRLLLVNVPRGSRAEARCKRKRCKSQVVRRTRSSTVTFKRFRGKTLKAGTVIEIRVTKKGFVGRYVKIKIKRGDFATAYRCMKPASKKPRRKC
jgi:dipeptidyl aminopeptidase/acylaminoacyl peptidase